jgi:uncharacterized repeat protein (TIGR02543 family)
MHHFDRELSVNHRKKLVNANGKGRKMKNEKGIMKKAHIIASLFFLSLLLIFSACQNPFAPTKLGNIPAGKGALSLSVTVAGTTRTILPSLDKSKFVLYTLNFAPMSGGTSHDKERSPAELSNPVYLEPGTYTLVVTAFLGPGATRPAARGSIDGLVISEGENVTKEVRLKAIIEEGKTGLFQYTVSFPSGLKTAEMEIKRLSLTGSLDQVVPVSSGVTGTSTLNSGYYNVVFTLKKTNGDTLVWRELLHVYASLESSFTKTFEDADFYKTIHTVTFVFNDELTSDAPSSVVHGTTVEDKPDDPTRSFAVVAGLYLGSLEDLLFYTFDGWYKDGSLYSFTEPVTEDITLTARWAAPASRIASVGQNNLATAVTYVNNNAAAGSYLLLIDSTVGASGQTLSAGNLTIIGMGSERTITATGVPLLTVNGASANLTLGEKITLQGMNNSTGNLVRVNSGTLYMKPGSKITGHTTSSANGAVYVNGETSAFIMEGGEISGNRSTYNNTDVVPVGGVYLNGSVMVMIGGEISGNTSSSAASNATGGVYVGENTATFIMIGGTISGNSSAYTSANNPADLDIHELATFNLSGNAIIGALMLFKYDNPAGTASISLDGSYTGSVASINLRRNVAIGTAISEWTNAILVKGLGYTPTASDIGRFTLGKFICNTSADNRPITGNPTGTNYRIGNTGADMGRLVAITPGTGVANDPFTISNEAQLRQIGTGSWGLDKDYKLVANITLNGNWTPIGTYDLENLYNSNPFTGSFDGNYHSITNLTITSSENFQGMFGAVSGEVRNLALIDCNISGADYVGGVVAGNGGIVENCSVTGSISGNDTVGGVVGYNLSGTVEKCYASCNVTGTTDNVGGVIGINASTVRNCYATGTVSGASYVGGVVGSDEYYSFVENCYATGIVSGNYSVGGVVGYHSGDAVKNCVGLNNRIIASTIDNCGRVIGYVTTSSESGIINNYGRDNMIPPIGGSWASTPNGNDGEDVNSGQYSTENWWTSSDNWNDSVWDFVGTWEWDSGRNLPKLTGVGGQ